jgi:hypothetical protein
MKTASTSPFFFPTKQSSINDEMASSIFSSPHGSTALTNGSSLSSAHDELPRCGMIPKRLC